MKPIQTHVVRTVVQRLIQDCTAAIGENERRGGGFLNAQVQRRRLSVAVVTGPHLRGAAFGSVPTWW